MDMLICVELQGSSYPPPTAQGIVCRELKSIVPSYRDHRFQSNLQPGPEDDCTSAHQLARAMKRSWWTF
jgi:hypothetical protein